MPTLQLTDDQVLELIRQLPPDRQRRASLALAEGAKDTELRLDQNENQLRRLAADHGLDWETMNDEQRLSFVDDLIHEDRACGQ